MLLHVIFEVKSQLLAPTTPHGALFIEAWRFHFYDICLCKQSQGGRQVVKRESVQFCKGHLQSCGPVGFIHCRHVVFPPQHRPTNACFHQGTECTSHMCLLSHMKDTLHEMLPYNIVLPLKHEGLELQEASSCALQVLSRVDWWDQEEFLSISGSSLVPWSLTAMLSRNTTSKKKRISTSVFKIFM